MTTTRPGKEAAVSVPDPDLDLLGTAVADAVRAWLPAIHQWLDGNGPPYDVIEIPVRLDDGRLNAWDQEWTRLNEWDQEWTRLTVQRRYYAAPAPWAVRVYGYIWPVAMLGAVEIARGEPYRLYDDHATLLATPGG